MPMGLFPRGKITLSERKNNLEKGANKKHKITYFLLTN
jgi:hypothetical protein